MVDSADHLPHDTVIHRLLYPEIFEIDGHLSSSVMNPYREIDHGCLSVDDGGMADACTFSTPYGVADSVGTW